MHYSKLSRVVFFEGIQYAVVCICTFITNIILEGNLGCFALFYLLQLIYLTYINELMCLPPIKDIIIKFLCINLRIPILLGLEGRAC